jgi:hypothetical protein
LYQYLWRFPVWPDTLWPALIGGIGAGMKTQAFLWRKTVTGTAGKSNMLQGRRVPFALTWRQTLCRYIIDHICFAGGPVSAEDTVV